METWEVKKNVITGVSKGSYFKIGILKQGEKK
jgi:hypothetical protein